MHYLLSWGDTSFTSESACNYDDLWLVNCSIQSAEVILGAHNIREEEPGQVRMVSSNFIVHEGYASGIDNDIGLIRLPESAPLNGNYP